MIRKTGKYAPPWTKSALISEIPIIYPRKSFFRIMVVIGQKEKEAVSALLSDCCSRLRDIYRETPEGNGQRWLMIDREDPDVLYNDMLRLIHIRSGKDLSKQKTNH